MVPPKTYEIKLRRGRADEPLWNYLIDDKSFDGLTELLRYIKTVPKESIIEYHVSDVTFYGDEPMRTTRELDRLREACRQAGMILIIYPGG